MSRDVRLTAWQRTTQHNFHRTRPRAAQVSSCFHVHVVKPELWLWIWIAYLLREELNAGGTSWHIYAALGTVQDCGCVRGCEGVWSPLDNLPAKVRTMKYATAINVPKGQRFQYSWVIQKNNLTCTFLSRGNDSHSLIAEIFKLPFVQTALRCIFHNYVSQLLFFFTPAPRKQPCSLLFYNSLIMQTLAIMTSLPISTLCWTDETSRSLWLTDTT